jgi:hypothetical protein
VYWTSIAYDSWRTTMVNARQAADREVMQGFLWGSIPSSALLVRIVRYMSSLAYFAHLMRYALCAMDGMTA